MLVYKVLQLIGIQCKNNDIRLRDQSINVYIPVKQFIENLEYL